TGRRRFGALVFSCMLGMSLLSTGAMMLSEGHSASAATPLLMEGKEVRFGADGTTRCRTRWRSSASCWCRWR
ncbi:hypothetical protein C7E12_18710, partial [Stenotrophomonas maltophilia]